MFPISNLFKAKIVEKSQKKSSIKDFAKWENIGQFLRFSTILATKKLHYTAVLYTYINTVQQHST